jgi:nucleoside-diphosphate-sugar epimerase
MERKIVVTGGSGYLGSHVTRALLDAGDHVRVLDPELFGGGLGDLDGDPRLQVLRGDVRSVADLARVARGADAIVHLAAVVGDAACRLDPDYTWTTNVEATKLVVDVCRRFEIPRLVFASTCSVYGAADDLVLNEGSVQRPVSLYARSKIESEAICLAAASEIPAVSCLRMATLYGLSPRMRFDLVVNIMTARALRDGAITVFGGAQWRPLVHAADAAAAFVLALDAPAELVSGQVFNVGSDDQNFRILDLGQRIAAAMGGASIDTREPSTEDLRNYRVSFAKIAHHLGYRTSRTIEHATDEIAQYLRAGGVDYRDDRFHNHRYVYSIDPGDPPLARAFLRTSDEQMAPRASTSTPNT